MSEHTPLTEAERIVREGRDAYLPSEGLDPAWIAGWHAATDHHAHALASQAKCPTCGHASHGEDDGCFEEVAFDRMCGCPDLTLAARTSAATTDTGLRERVEAKMRDCLRLSATAMDAEVREWTAAFGKDLKAILDATAAPTTDTGARDE